ncbi:MAG TPA: glycosyltransferase family 9 protein [Opitutaceae bacterium]|nr:glycosyltransferase family 9 protein [Opitutaceae bacterium]
MTLDPGTAPASVAIVKVDTMGDLVLFAPALQALGAAWPSARFTVVIRRAYVDLATAIAPAVNWLPTTLDPFARGPDQDTSELERLCAVLRAAAPEVIVAATSRRNWLETVLAGTSGARRRLALGGKADDAFFATQLRIGLGIDASAAYTEFVSVAQDDPDWVRNLQIAGALLGRPLASVAPTLHIGEAPRAAAAQFLSARGLIPGKYVVCAAAGFANVALKTWPPDRFGTVVRRIREHHGLPVLLIGHESERTHLESAAATAGGDVPMWLGREGMLLELAALVAGAALYVGNDTGAMHLAGALDVPVVGVFGGGTWPRFRPAGRRSVAVVQPLPCFGCGWDCAFGDAPCIGGITVDDVTAAVAALLTNPAPDFSETREVRHLPDSTTKMMGKAAQQYHDARHDHLARQHKLEELTALDREKDSAILEKESEIAALKAVCNEREQSIFTLNGHVKNLQAHIGTLEANNAVLEKTLRDLPPDAAKAARAVADQTVHIRNIESLLRMREQELAEARASAANRAAGLHDLEQAKHYGHLLSEKERVIRSLRRGCEERESVIRQLSAQATTPTAKARKAWTAVSAWVREKAWRPFDAWLFRALVERYWMQIGVLRHYDPRPLQWDRRIPRPRLADASLPQVAIVTPSYGQETFVERTLRSVLDQHYPKLRYVVQDGASKDGSIAIIERFADRLQHWESVPDKGQADAISRGFAHVTNMLGPDDVMAWLNSDDLLGPGVLRFVAEFFAQHPEIDVVYGHRIIINDDDREIGRWIMPRHDPATLEWIDYVPQETMFWRKRAWDLAGGIDPSFQFALDWDLLARFQQAGCHLVRVPYFLGAFRVHANQKTSQVIHTTGADEMRRIRTRFHGERHDDFETIERHAREARFRGAVTARLHAVGIRW